MADPSLEDAVVRGGDEVGLERFGPPPSFIRGYTTIFMGHMKNEVRAFITASSRPFLAPFFLDACRRRNRRWCASQYFGTRFRGRVLGGGTLPRIVGRKEGVRFRGIFTPYGSKTRSRSIYIYIYSKGKLQRKRICKIFYSGCSIRIHFSRGSSPAERFRYSRVSLSGLPFLTVRALDGHCGGYRG